MAKTSVPGAARSTAKPGLEPGAKPAPAAPKPETSDTSALSLKQLAEAVVTRTVKPRIADIRRLAEGVLAAQGKSRKADGKKDGGKKAKGKKGKQKLAKIPGQKKKA